MRLAVADLTEVALLTAMRPGELRGLARERLDRHAGVIKVTVSRPETKETKTGDDRLIPMRARVREILEARCRLSRSR